MRQSENEKHTNMWNPQLYDGRLGFVSEYGRSVIDWLNPLQGERILDLGCGTGDLSAQIAESGVDVTGIDSSSEMILEARSKYPHLSFLVADAEDLHGEGTYNAVFSNAALHWMRQPANVIRGVWGALESGGRFVGEFGSQGNVRCIVDALSQVLTSYGVDAAARNPWFFPSAGQYATILEAQGFTVRNLVTFDRPTVLADGENGLRHWLDMFCGVFTTGFNPEQMELIYKETTDLVRVKLWSDGSWKMDYVRLRFVAQKL